METMQHLQWLLWEENSMLYERYPALEVCKEDIEKAKAKRSRAKEEKEVVEEVTQE